MCGIHLIIDKKGLLGDENILGMVNASTHRGPDHLQHTSCKFGNGKLWLGVNQLTITDNSEAARQPLQTGDGKCHLIYNGEIYNHFDLKNPLLTSGIRFNSQSDTETLLHHLSVNGKDGVRTLNGMFAFVFVDTRQNTVNIARDYFGIKPLYYFHNNELFIASSSIQSIIASGLVKAAINHSQIGSYLRGGYIEGPETFYDGVKELAPATIATIDEQLRLGQGQFTPLKKTDEPDVSPEKVRTLLTDSIIAQLDIRQPTGLMLSGGVDSTLIMALAYKEGITLPTYSIVNKKNEARHGTTDFKYTRRAANQYLSAHHHQIVSTQHDLQHFNAFADALDQPNGDPGAFSNYILAKEAKKDIRILLNGAGADEYFGGYNRHFAYQYYLRNAGKLLKAKKYALPIIQWMTAFGGGDASRINHVIKLLKDIEEDPSDTFANFISDNAFPVEAKKVKLDEGDPIGSALRFDQQNFLAKNVLPISDRMSMAQSIELRVPYLDNALVSYVSSFNGEQILTQGKKWLLKSILNEEGGTVYSKRRKQGFGPPVGFWLRKKEGRELMEQLTTGSSLIRGLIAPELIDRLVKSHMSGKADNGRKLWKLIVLSHWLEKF